MFISGTSGHAAEDQAHKYPYMHNGHLLRLNFAKNIYEMNIQQSTGGTLSGSPLSGESGTVFGLTATPLTNHWHLDSYGLSGATLTGNSGTYTNSDVSAKPTWHEDPKYTLTIQQSTGGTLAGSPSSGYSGDKFGLTATPASTAYTFKQYNVTGATMTGNSGMFRNSNVTAKAQWQTTSVKVDFDIPTAGTGKPALLAQSGNNYSTVFKAATSNTGAYLRPNIINHFGRVYPVPTADWGTPIIQTWYLYPVWQSKSAGNNAMTGWPVTNTAYANYGLLPSAIDIGYNLLVGSGKKYYCTAGNLNDGVYSMPNVFSFSSNAYISGFSGFVSAEMNLSSFMRYRVTYDGTTGSWSNQYSNTTYGTAWQNIPITIPKITANNPIKIELSGYRMVTATSPKKYVAPVGYIYAGDWLGKFCHVETVDV